MAYNRKQAYYNREYDRLITQAKKQFNEMNLGSVFGPSLPTFEKILNFAGTRSGLKRPTKQSLKALRKIQGEEGILWAVQYTLPKKDTAALEKVQYQRKELQKQQKAISEAKTKIKERYKDTYSQMSRQERREFLSEVLYSVNTLLTELRYWRNYSFELLSGNTVRKQSRKERLSTAYATAKELIEIIETILGSGDSDKIESISAEASDFYSSHAEGVAIQDLYNGGREVGPYVRRALQGMVGRYKESSIEPVNSEMQQQEVQTGNELPKPEIDKNDTFDPFDEKLFQPFDEDEDYLLE